MVEESLELSELGININHSTEGSGPTVWVMSGWIAYEDDYIFGVYRDLEDAIAAARVIMVAQQAAQKVQENCYENCEGDCDCEWDSYFYDGITLKAYPLI